MALKVERFEVGPLLQCPCLVWDDPSMVGVLIDPGFVDPAIDRAIEQHGVKLKAIINTHAHLDHVGGVTHYKRKYNLPFYLHPNELDLLAKAPEYATMFGFDDYEPVTGEILELNEGQEILLTDTKFRVIETPGHTVGGVVFYTPGHAFVGDTLFAGSVGRTDLPGGDFPTLQNSLRRLLKLPDEAKVYSGHGPLTTIGQERKTNPFLLDI